MAATKTIGVPNLLMVNARDAGRPRLPDHRAAVRGQGRPRRGPPRGREPRPEGGREVVSPVQLHPGAQRFYDRRGAGDAARRDRARPRWRSPAPGPTPRRRATGRGSWRARRPGSGGRGEPAAPARGLRARLPPLGLPAPARGALPRRAATAASRSWPSPRRARRCSTTTRSRAAARRRGRPLGAAAGAPAALPHAALAATRIGRRTLVAGGERIPLWRADGRAAHLRITVEGG